MTSVHCPKCRAGRGALEARLEHLENGTVLQTVRCVLCGFRRSRMESRITAARREVLLAANPDPDLVFELGDRSLTDEFGVRRCAVVGCERKLNQQNRSGFCHLHGNGQIQWEKGKRTNPPPLLPAGDGRYMVNPARMTQEVTA